MSRTLLLWWDAYAGLTVSLRYPATAYLVGAKSLPPSFRIQGTIKDWNVAAPSKVKDLSNRSCEFLNILGSRIISGSIDFQHTALRMRGNRRWMNIKKTWSSIPDLCRRNKTSEVDGKTFSAGSEIDFDGTGTK